jgi:hypothetical protein
MAKNRAKAQLISVGSMKIIISSASGKKAWRGEIIMANQSYGESMKKSGGKQSWRHQSSGVAAMAACEIIEIMGM